MWVLLERLATYELQSARVRFWSLRTLGKGGAGGRPYSRGRGGLPGPESGQVGLRGSSHALRQGALLPNRNGSSSGGFSGSRGGSGPTGASPDCDGGTSLKPLGRDLMIGEKIDRILLFTYCFRASY